MIRSTDDRERGSYGKGENDPNMVGPRTGFAQELASQLLIYHNGEKETERTTSVSRKSRGIKVHKKKCGMEDFKSKRKELVKKDDVTSSTAQHGPESFFISRLFLHRTHCNTTHHLMIRSRGVETLGNATAHGGTHSRPDAHVRAIRISV